MYELPRGQKHENSMEFMEFHVEYSMELTWNTTGLHEVFICYRPRGLTIERGLHENFTEVFAWDLM